MRTSAIVAALAATLNSALADVVCNSEPLHYKPRMISAAERDGFAYTIDTVCDNTIDKSVQEPFESTVFSRTRTEDTFSTDECKANFQSIIEACIAGKNVGSGSLVTNGLTVEIHLKSSNNEARGLGSAQKRKAKKAKASKKKKAKKTKASKKKKAKKTKSKNKKKAKKPTACNLKSDKAKGTGKGKTNEGKTDEGKKTATKVVRDLISKLLGRAGSEGKKSPTYGSDCDEIMEQFLKEEVEITVANGGNWGEDTWRGIHRLTANTIDPDEVIAHARSGFRKIQKERKSKTGIVVAALFVPEKGVFLGTPAHGSGEAHVRAWAPGQAPFLWKILKDRTYSDPTKTSGSMYHAEDVAMLMAVQNYVDGKTKFPEGSLMASYGKAAKTF
ncbi:hypothetical protein K504DRAFT_532452 [Pleomassaria siparia CBS 279.74]|uniref:Uncharacterized protein n=1 Tax=Pleomassaria siparia CBS 279.74 TaxID=1314801 RepID=A0A6G1KDZ5_9PLEO|nr:hypothetical protein K504DRAFT_532452 [Pleomassaria siparia CBS 279.74]